MNDTLCLPLEHSDLVHVEVADPDSLLEAGFVDIGYNGTNEGIRVSINSVSAWYPASGFRYFDDGSVGYIGMDGYYWSADPSRTDVYYLYFNSAGNVRPSFSNYRSFGFAVRCQKE